MLTARALVALVALGLLGAGCREAPAPVEKPHALKLLDWSRSSSSSEGTMEIAHVYTAGAMTVERPVRLLAITPIEWDDGLDHVATRLLFHRSETRELARARGLYFCSGWPPERWGPMTTYEIGPEGLMLDTGEFFTVALIMLATQPGTWRAAGMRIVYEEDGAERILTSDVRSIEIARFERESDIPKGLRGCQPDEYAYDMWEPLPPRSA